MNTNDLNQTSALELMLRWNHYCDTHNRQGDCILLNEDRTYVEAFENEDQAMKEIVNSDSPDFKRNEGYLITLYDDKGYYREMKWVAEEDVWKYIDLNAIGCYSFNANSHLFKYDLFVYICTTNQ